MGILVVNSDDYKCIYLYTLSVQIFARIYFRELKFSKNFANLDKIREIR